MLFRSSGDASGGFVGSAMLAPLGLVESDLNPIVERVKQDFDNASSFLRTAA